MKRVMIIAGARPNFMKIAPILRAAEKSDLLKIILVNTNQHYSQSMSSEFFDNLEIRKPDYSLSYDASKSSHAYQTAHIMTQLEDICNKELPDIVLVVGDVNSTVAAALTAKKLNIKLCHVEAGLRSYDRAMPEEINRIVTDSISDILFVTEESGINNLLKEGHDRSTIHYVGNVMIDNLFHQMKQISFSESKWVSPDILDLAGKIKNKYLCFTLHRPSNVDDSIRLQEILDIIEEVSKKIPVIFSCHLRTSNNMLKFGINPNFIKDWSKIDEISSGVIQLGPLGYNDFLYLWKNSEGVITDSGGIQEETTALKIPCLTLRESTERPVTVTIGSNELITGDLNKIHCHIDKILDNKWKECTIPYLWDGKASERIVEILSQ